MNHSGPYMAGISPLVMMTRSILSILRDASLATKNPWQKPPVQGEFPKGRLALNQNYRDSVSVGFIEGYMLCKYVHVDLITLLTKFDVFSLDMATLETTRCKCGGLERAV